MLARFRTMPIEVEAEQVEERRPMPAANPAGDKAPGVNPGHWLVLWPSGLYEQFDDADFRHRFEAVDA